MAGPNLPMVYGSQNKGLPYQRALRYLLHEITINQHNQDMTKVYNTKNPMIAPFDLHFSSFIK